MMATSNSSGEDTLAIHVEMALQRFKVLLTGEMDDEAETYRITYLKMKTVLVKEFGQSTFDEVKQHVRDTMQQMEQHHLMPAADGADQLDTSNLFDRPPGSYALGSGGKFVWAKVTRPTKHSLGFNVVGGCDKAYGGAFVSNVGSDSASQLQTGDRLLAVNSKGLIALRHTELQQVLTELPQKFQILVLRLSSGHWRELQAEVDVTDDPEYELYCRGVSKLPLINQLQMAYQGKDSSCGWSDGPSTTGAVVTIMMYRSPGERLGIKMAGAYELGGVFITDIAPKTAAAEEHKLEVGARLLEVNGRSVIFATQDAVAHAIKEGGDGEIALTFQVLPMVQWSMVFNHSATDEAFKAVVRAHEARQAKRNKDAIAYYQAALKHDSSDPMLRCQALGGLGTVYFAVRQFKNSVRYHSLEVDAVSACTAFDNAFSLARALDNLGLANRYAGDLRAAIAAYERELDCARDAHNLPTLGRTYSNLGITHGMMKQYKKSISCHEKSLALANEDEDKRAAGRAHGNLGISYGLLKKYSKALTHHEERLKIAVDLKDEQGQYRALGNMCSAAKQSGDQVLAKQYWDRQQSCSFVASKSQALSNAAKAAAAKTTVAASRSAGSSSPSSSSAAAATAPIVAAMEASEAWEDAKQANAAEADADEIVAAAATAVAATEEKDAKAATERLTGDPKLTAKVKEKEAAEAATEVSIEADNAALLKALALDGDDNVSSDGGEEAALPAAVEAVHTEAEVATATATTTTPAAAAAAEMVATKLDDTVAIATATKPAPHRAAAKQAREKATADAAHAISVARNSSDSARTDAATAAAAAVVSQADGASVSTNARVNAGGGGSGGGADAGISQANNGSNKRAAAAAATAASTFTSAGNDGRGVGGRDAVVRQEDAIRQEDAVRREDAMEGTGFGVGEKEKREEQVEVERKEQMEVRDEHAGAGIALGRSSGGNGDGRDGVSFAGINDGNDNDNDKNEKGEEEEEEEETVGPVWAWKKANSSVESESVNAGSFASFSSGGGRGNAEKGSFGELGFASASSSSSKRKGSGEAEAAGSFASFGSFADM